MNILWRDLDLYNYRMIASPPGSSAPKGAYLLLGSFYRAFSGNFGRVFFPRLYDTASFISFSF